MLDKKELNNKLENILCNIDDFNWLLTSLATADFSSISKENMFGIINCINTHLKNIEKDLSETINSISSN